MVKKLETSFDVIIVGAGLAGLSCAVELTKKKKKVLILEAEPVIGGRTSSYNVGGMEVESGFHRFIGYYSHLPKILKTVGINLDDMLTWEEKVHVRVTDKHPMEFGMAPVFGATKTIKGLIGNNQYLSTKDKLSLIPFFINGFKDYLTSPNKLDSYSIKKYALQHGVTTRAFHSVVIPLSTGVFFLPPERYSAYVFFGLFAPAIPKFYKMRVGAYLGGMTEVMCKPIADWLVRKGGTILTNAKVDSLIYRDNKIEGVTLKSGETLLAKHTVVATSLHSAKQLLFPYFSDDDWFKPMFKLPLMPAVSMQIELTEPALPLDVTTFAPYTYLASFAEQSRTTFRNSKGRLSIILSPPEKFLMMDPKDTLEIIIKDAKRIGIHLDEKILSYRQVNHFYDFHTLEPGYQNLRPTQKTHVNGLLLAGDYTKQPYFATMEGATYSGIKAAKLILAVK